MKRRGYISQASDVKGRDFGMRIFNYMRQMLAKPVQRASILFNQVAQNMAGIAIIPPRDEPYFMVPGTFTRAALPDAAGCPTQFAYITDGLWGPTFVQSDGTSWIERNGSHVLFSSGAPSGSDGSIGDTALDTVACDVYEKTGASTWALRGNIKGATGAAGSAGSTGATGSTGAAGATGSTGSGGATGATGAAGTNGTNGTNGADAPTPAQTAVTRALNTAFRPSTTRPTFGVYSVQIQITASISGGQNGDVILEIASDSGFTTNVQTVSIAGSGQTYTLAIALQGVQPQTNPVMGMIPANYYARLRTVNNTGTPVFTYRAGQETTF